jgi:hypothetical protein
MLRAVLSAFCSEKAASRIASALGIAVSAVLAASGMVGWPDVNFSALFFALFLFFGAILAKRETTPPVAAVVLRGYALSQRGAMRLSTVAAVSDMPARAALTRLRGASLLAVVDHSFRLLGTLAEGDLLQGMISRGPDVTLEELLKNEINASLYRFYKENYVEYAIWGGAPAPPGGKACPLFWRGAWHGDKGRGGGRRPFLHVLSGRVRGRHVPSRLKDSVLR